MKQNEEIITVHIQSVIDKHKMEGRCKEKGLGLQSCEVLRTHNIKRKGGNKTVKQSKEEKQTDVLYIFLTNYFTV